MRVLLLHIGFNPKNNSAVKSMRILLVNILLKRMTTDNATELKALHYSTIVTETGSNDWLIDKD